MPRLPEVYAVWCGPLKTPEEYRTQHGVSEVRYVDELQAFLQELAPPEIYLLQGKNTDSGSIAKPGASCFWIAFGMVCRCVFSLRRDAVLL